MAKLRVAMIAPPWLSVPPTGYGGIEYIVHYLCTEFANRDDIEVELFTVKGSTTPAAKKHYYYETDQYLNIAKILYDAVTIPVTHNLFALQEIKRAGNFDIIHDHNGFIGPAAMAYGDQDLPPVLHTLHGPFSNDESLAAGVPDNRPMYEQLASAERFYINGISKSQLSFAPAEVADRVVGVVHNAIGLNDFKLETAKKDYFVTLGRFTPDKNQGLAAKLCQELDLPLKMIGIVAGLADPKELAAEIANPSSQLRSNADFRYYRDQIVPTLIDGKIEYVGGPPNDIKNDLIGHAKALLFPINWEEPFGMAPIEALACGTPVVSMARGALPEIIDHGVNGFLAKTEAEFKKYMTMVDQIDPAACRKSVEDKFSAQVMADSYLKLYQQIMAQSSR